MAVPKKKTARSRSKVRYKTYVQRTQKKLLNFVERAKRNLRGAEKVSQDAAASAQKNTTTIEA